MDKRKLSGKRSSDPRDCLPPPPPDPSGCGIGSNIKESKKLPSSESFIRLMDYKKRENEFLKNLNESIEMDCQKLKSESEKRQQEQEQQKKLLPTSSNCANNDNYVKNNLNNNENIIDDNFIVISSSSSSTFLNKSEFQLLHNECDNFIVPLLNRTGPSISAALVTNDAFEQLNRLHGLLDQMLTIQEQNYKMRNYLKDIRTLGDLKKLQKKDSNELFNEDGEISDTELDLDNNTGLLNTILAAGNSASSKRNSSKRQRERSKSVIADDISLFVEKDLNRPNQSRRQSVFSEGKAKISKWTKVKAAFKWERANVLALHEGKSLDSGIGLTPVNNEVARYLRVPAPVPCAGSSADSVLSSSIPATPGTISSASSIEDVGSEEMRRDSSKSDSRCESQINNLDDENRRSRSLDAYTILAQVGQTKSKTPWKKVKNIIQTHKGSFKKGRSRSIKSNTSEKESRDVSPCDSIERFDSSEQTSPTQKSQQFKIQNNTNKSQQNSPISESEPTLVQYPGECISETKLLKSPNKLIRKSKIVSDFESLPEDTIFETKSNNKKSLNRPPPSPLNLSVRLDSSDAEFCDTSYSPTILLKSPSKLLRYTKALASGNSSVPSSPSRHSEFFGEFESEDLSSGDFSEPSTPHRKLSQKSSFEAQKEEINERYMELREKLNQEFEAKRQEWEKIRSVCCTSTSCAYQLISKDESSIQSNKNIPSKMLEENLSADFKKKLHKWRVKKQISSASIKGDMNSPTKECETKKIDWNLWKSGQLKLDGQGLTPLPDQKNLPEDFQKKLEQWKKMKDTNTVPSYQGNNDSLRRSSGKFGMGIKMTENSKKSKQEDDKSDRDKHQRPERDKNKSNDKDKLEKLSKLKAIVTDPRAKEIEVQTSIGVMKFEGISRKFTRKLYEWEKARGIGPESSTFALLHPGYRPLDVGKITKEKRSHENSPNLGRSLSLDSISPNPSMLSISHQTSSLSLNDVTDLKESGSLKDRKIVSNPEIEDKDLQDEPEAVIVEVEDDIIETAAPLVSVLPMAEHQTPIYRYEEIACKDFRSARKLEQIENNSKISVETMENVNRVTLYLDEHKNDYTENILYVMGILNSLNKSIPNLEKYTTQRNPTTRNAMEIVKKLVAELIGQLTELNEDEACCQETINERTNLIGINLRNLQKSINLICQYVKTSEKNIPKINITADDCIDRSIATVSITPTIFQSEIIINQPKVLIAGFSNTINNTVVDSSELSYNNASQSQPEFSETSSGKKVHRNVSNGSKKKTRLRRIGSRQNSKTESDSSDDDATNNVVLETQRRLKRKSSRNKKSTEEEKHENENHDIDGFNGDDIVYVLKIKPGQPIKQEEIYNEQNNELNNSLISPTETCIQLLNVSEENLTSTSANVFVKTKRKLFTTVSESTISSGEMTFSMKDVESSSDRTSSERTEKENSSKDNISLTSLPPIPQSPNYSRRYNELCKNLPKEPSPSIRMMIAKYNQKLESDKSPTSSGTCTPSSMRSPVLERRNVIEQSYKYEQNLDNVKKSASAGNISNNSNNNMNLPIMEYSFGKEKRKLKRLSKSFSADLLPQKNDVINNNYLSKNQYIQSLACDSLKIINKTSGINSKNIQLSDKKEHIYRKHKDKPTSLIVGKLGALKKIDAKNKNDNIWRRSISSGDTEIENYSLQPNRSDNTIPKITRKLEAKATTPTEKSHPNSSDLWHPTVSLPLKNLYDFDRPKTPLTERALKLQKAKEEFLRRTPSKSPSTGDNDSKQDFNWTHHRLSQVSVGSETSNENNCALLKSASVGMIAEDNDNNSEHIVGYESLPRNVSRSGKITSKLGFAMLASKFSKVKIRNNNNKDQKLPTPKINVVSALCRQSLLLDLNTQSQEICSKNLTKSKSLQISGFGTIFKPKYKDKLNKSKSAHIVPNDKK